MNLSNFLSSLDFNQIDIWLENGELLIRMEQESTLPVGAHEFILENKQIIMKRLLNNSFAQSRGWIVANYGEVYCYQYSSTGYVFIERNKDEMVDVYRCKFDKHQQITNIKGLYKSISFSSAYQKTKSFLKWFYSENSNMTKRY